MFRIHGCTIYDFAKKALPLATTPQNITAGFEVSGIFPLNRFIFQDHDFAPSEVTDQPEHVTGDTTLPSTSEVCGENTLPPTSEVCNENPTNSNLPSIALDGPDYPLEFVFVDANLNSPSTSNQSQSKLAHFSPQAVRPLPKGTQSTTNRGRKKGKSAVLTSSPMKAELEAKKSSRTTIKKPPLDKKKKP